MPVVVYSVLRLALLAVSWLLLTWAGLHPLAALLVAAFVAWGLSYVALGGPRDAAARYLAERAAVRAAHAGRPVLSPHAQEDADAEDAAVDAALAGRPTSPASGGRVDRGPDEQQEGQRAEGPDDGPEGEDGPRAEPGSAQSASASPSSRP